MIITGLEALPDTFFNQRYGSEIIEKIRNTEKSKLIRMINWMVSTDELITFTATVTFKNLVGYEASSSMKKATKYEYEKRVLTKIKKRLSRISSRWNSVIPIEYFFQYEYDQGSFFKPVSSRSHLHHIHGIFPVPKSLANRIFDFENHQLDGRLDKDLKSLRTVSTYLIEPLRSETASDWLNYLLKEKTTKDINPYWT